MKVTVRVPASTSNLGPGYDSLGMALSLQAKFTFEPLKKRCARKGPDHE